MARIRTVKPDFFTHPSITPLSIPARLLLLSLLTQADDEGRLYDQGAKIRGLAFGDEDRVNIAGLLAELADHRRILRYEIGDRDCIEIVGFHDHQRINRPTPSLIPPPGLFAEPSPNGQGVLTEPSSPEGKGREGNKEGKWKGTGKAATAAVFVSFWDRYPRNVGRRKAEAAFEAALRRGATPDEILLGAERFANDPNLPEATYIPYPTTWLNRDGWNDDPLPPRAGKPAVPGLRSHQLAQQLREEGR